MEQAKVQNLALTAARSRLLALDMVYGAASGHIGGSLSSLDILTTLYFHVMRVNPDAPQAPERDRFVLSKGHCTPALYSTMAQRGFFPLEELKQFRRIEGHMSGHAEMRHVKGVDMSTGSLGQGISAAVGMALAGKADGRDYRVYALLGDGEIEEGQVWEAAMAAAKYRLDNLCAVVDVNGLQIDGATADVMPSEPLDRHPCGRPRLRRPGGGVCCRRGLQGKAHGAPGQDGEGQGCVLHGGGLRLAWQGPQRRAV